MFTNFKSLVDKTFISNVKTEPCIEHRQHPKLIEFSIKEKRTIYRGKCLNHLENCIIYNGMDTETGELFTVKEWTVYNIDPTVEQKIREHLNLLIDLEHENLAQLKNFTYEYAEDNRLIFYILQEFVCGANLLSLFLMKNFPIPIDVLRHIASGVLNSLNFLCNNDIVWPNLMDTCICINDNGDIKLINYEINENFPSSTQQQLECHNENMYNFGILLLSLVKGEVIKLDDAEIPKTVPSILHDFLVRCVTSNSDKQIITELLNHSFIQTSCDVMSFVDVPETPEILCSPEVLERPLSRLELDFKILELLGQGGFGKVYKAQKILDGRVYALKEIKLKPNNEKLNNKLIREVQYLSMLNHENIVRYYSAWTDVGNTTDTDDETDSSCLESSRAVQYEMGGDVDRMEIINKTTNSEGYLYMESPNSGLNDYYEECYIVKDAETAQEANADEENDTNSKDSSAVTPSTEDYMPLMVHSNKKLLYLQMEFYEGKTLQNVIDSNELYWDITRISKFLREIVEGLAYIHQQNIIHRDLKPLNIFLDSNDHIKIGDFGLATTNTRYKRDIQDKNKQTNEDATALDTIENGSSTSQVGTGLYKAPELSSNVRICDQKLDMYSLGIILFEMCYKRPITDSERIDILSKLRLKEIVFPKNFDKGLHYKRKLIIRKLLNHNPLERPTSHELLKNKDIPPILEEKKQQEMFKYVVDNPHIKLYKYLMEICFHQTNNYNNYNNVMFEYRNISKLNYVTNVVTKIFELHGGQNLRMPAVMPQNSCYSDCQNCVKLMTRSGRLVLIPCNNRMPFIRHVMNKDSTWLRRYSIEKIKIPTRLPEEAYECVFDIITPTNIQNIVVDAEILKIVTEIKDSFPDLEPNGFSININHSLLIKAILHECGIEGSRQNYAVIIKILKCVILVSKSSFLRDYLPEDVISKLLTLTDTSSSVMDIGILQLFTNIGARNMANIALEELNQIVEIAKKFGVTSPIRMTPGLMQNFEQHSGLLVELVYVSKNKRHVLAAGGRYDINKILSSTSIPENGQIFKYGVGISVHLESVFDLLEHRICTKNSNVVICSFNEKVVLDEKMKILCDLWSAGISCSFIHVATKNDLQSWCKRYNVLWAILLVTNDIDQGIVTLMKWKHHKNLFEERKINYEEVTTVLKCYTNQEQIVPRLKSLCGNRPVKKDGLRIRTQSEANYNACSNNSNSVP